MNGMELKIGDKVKVREDLQLNKEYGNAYVNKEMFLRRGKIATIETIVPSSGGNIYHTNLSIYGWNGEMLERVEDDKESREGWIERVVIGNVKKDQTLLVKKLYGCEVILDEEIENGSWSNYQKVMELNEEIEEGEFKLESLKLRQELLKKIESVEDDFNYYIGGDNYQAKGELVKELYTLYDELEEYYGDEDLDELDDKIDELSAKLTTLEEEVEKLEDEEVSQWLLVSEWLYSKLKGLGEVVIHSKECNEYWWGRKTSDFIESENAMFELYDSIVGGDGVNE